MYRRILLTLDGNVEAEHALPHAVMLAQNCQAELFLLRVLAPLPMNRTLSGQALEVSTKVAREWAWSYLLRRATEIERYFSIRVWADVTEGEPHRKIVAFAEKHQIDLIVMFTRGHSGLRKLFEGSTSERVVASTKVPVLLVRAPLDLRPQPVEPVLSSYEIAG
jgi:nucleotide-binding universal stress UspA family protein